jgi:hypothetical protein
VTHKLGVFRVGVINFDMGVLEIHIPSFRNNLDFTPEEICCRAGTPPTSSFAQQSISSKAQGEPHHE